MYGRKMSILLIGWNPLEELGKLSIRQVYFNKIKFYLNRKVHVTQQTLDLLEDEYFFDMGTEEARKDLIFRENNIRTYLISPQSRYAMDSQYIQEEPSSRRISKGIDYLMRKKARVCLLHLL